jgi:hypothetical protein
MGFEIKTPALWAVPFVEGDKLGNSKFCTKHNQPHFLPFGKGEYRISGEGFC